MTAIPEPAITDLPADGGAAAARAHVETVVRRSGTSFFWGMRLLSRQKREAMFAIYAFCREVDDIADGPGSAAEKHAKLALWRAEVEALFRGRPSLPTARALLDPVAHYGLPAREFHAMIDGMEMDAGGRMRAPALDELAHYCRCVAGAVGQLSVRVFGEHGPRAEAGAFALGEALQLTNILRDLREDAAYGRLYLPRELLRRHGIEADEPERVLDHPSLPAVCFDLAARAEARFAAASSWLADAERARVRAARVMMHVYRRQLARLMAHGWRDLDRPVRLGRAERLWLALRHGLL